MLEVCIQLTTTQAPKGLFQVTENFFRRNLTEQIDK